MPQELKVFIKRMASKILIFSQIPWLQDIQERPPNETSGDCEIRKGPDHLHQHHPRIPRISAINQTPKNSIEASTSMQSQIPKRIGIPVLLLMGTAQKLLDTVVQWLLMIWMPRIQKNAMRNGRIHLTTGLSVTT
jgi:hypothetical protein